MQEQGMESLWSSSQLDSGNFAYVEGLYELYLSSPEDVPQEWRSYFDSLPQVNGHVKDTPHSPIQAQFLELSKSAKRLTTGGELPLQAAIKLLQVHRLIDSYRQRGHQKAQLDPLGLQERPDVPDLTLAYHGLSQDDLDVEFPADDLFVGKSVAKLKDIIQDLEGTYCRTLGAEFMHIVDSEERQWFQEHLESVHGLPRYSNDQKIHILERLTAAEGLEKFLGSKYPGVKRFGLEGGESLIPLMDEVIQNSGGSGVKEVVIGMAHRGRLNVLINTLGKRPSNLFDEFDGKATFDHSGDVKYHQGFSSNVSTPGGEVHMALAFNPSHLEIVSPVVEGSVRARQDRRQDVNGDRVLPILIHGDAAFAGQGVCMETLQLSQTRAYKTGGTIHIVINNQVGFTTSNPHDARSTEYCTDVAKLIEAPVLHVNGDDPEAVFFAAQLASDYRHRFRKDVVVDMICYRRRGHNEADEPAATQPKMYKVIRSLKTTKTLYAEKLLADKVLTAEQAKALEDDYRKALEVGDHVVKSLVKDPNKELFVDWGPYLGHEWTAFADTGVDRTTLNYLSERLLSLPDGFKLQRQVEKTIEGRKKMASGETPMNWGFAELMAYASLLHEGHPVRITGQDVGRGTFVHRHAVLHDQNTGDTHVSLQHINAQQPNFDIYDSLLSEEAVLGFEYGYATTMPNVLVVWEAQFGDFANGAQVVIDQFITSGEHKWGRLCGLSMFLPHGYEGQGPEHSSARLERFLQLCAEHNVQVCVPTTPAQVFHMIRRQVIRPLRKPLIVMTPKSLLRHPLAISTLQDLSDESFHTVLPEIDSIDPDQVRRMVLCSGKVYYDLLERRRKEELSSTVIVRIEQLYPFPEEVLEKVMQPYPRLQDVVWCQEEPMNQGAWYSSQHHMRRVIGKINTSLNLRYAGREASAAPAAGYMALHLEQQEQLIKDALGI